MLRTATALAVIAMCVPGSPSPVATPTPLSLPTGAQSFDELILPAASVQPIDPEAAFRDAAAHHFDVEAATNDAASDDAQRRSHGKALLASGIARHVVYAGQRFRVDDLNSGRATLQRCDTGTIDGLDPEHRVVVSAPLNNIAVAYALGLSLQVTPSEHRAPAGSVHFDGRIEPSGAYSLVMTFRAVDNGAVPGVTAVNRYRFTYAVPIATPGCPIADDGILNGSNGPLATLSPLRATFEALNAQVDARMDPAPSGLPSLTSYDLSYPARVHGIIVRLHVHSATLSDPALSIPADWKHVRALQPNP